MSVKTEHRSVFQRRTDFVRCHSPTWYWKYMAFGRTPCGAWYVGGVAPKPLSGDAPAGVLWSSTESVSYLPDLSTLSRESLTPIPFSSKIFREGVRGNPLFVKRGFPGVLLPNIKGTVRMVQPDKAVISKFWKWHLQRRAIRLWLKRSEPYCFLSIM